MERSRLLWEDFLLLRLEIECLTVVKEKIFGKIVELVLRETDNNFSPDIYTKRLGQLLHKRLK